MQFSVKKFFFLPRVLIGGFQHTTLGVIDAVTHDGWLEIDMSPNQPSHFYLDLMGSTDPFMNLLHHFHTV